MNRAVPHPEPLPCEPDPDGAETAGDLSIQSPLTQSLELSDGRRLGYAEFGDPHGMPAFFFHGEPGSRLSCAILDEHATGAGVRLIALDRPGFGYSSMQPGRRFGDWPADVLATADHLGIDRFLVVGWSGGGPYALACAAAAPDRVRAAGVLAGVDRLGHLHPRAVKSLGGLRGFSFDPGRWAESISRTWVQTTKGPEGTPAAAALIAAGIREAVREGPAGVLHELRLLSREWDFDPGAIRGVPVRFWHGHDDALISTQHTRALAARIPGAQAAYLPSCGHVTLVTVHGREILAALKQAAT